MMSLAYNCKGVIVTGRVPSGTTATADYLRQLLQNLRRKLHANRPDLLGNGTLILHDYARPQLGEDFRELLLPHPPYSRNMSPPDFEMFPKLKINMRGVRFSMLEDLPAHIPDASRQLNFSRELTGNMDVPKSWDAVIRRGGNTLKDYNTLPHIWCSVL
jgi:hypothetical protein